MGTGASLDQVYAEVKRIRLELKSLEKSLDTLAELLIPEEKVAPKEMRELKALKKEALSGECVSFEDVLNKHGAKRSASRNAVRNKKNFEKIQTID